LSLEISYTQYPSESQPDSLSSAEHPATASSHILEQYPLSVFEQEQNILWEWGKMSSPKRRIETDVMKMMMSDYEVTLVNDNMQEFYVSFKGPSESGYLPMCPGTSLRKSQL
jgi:hypothetical protein